MEFHYCIQQSINCMQSERLLTRNLVVVLVLELNIQFWSYYDWTFICLSLWLETIVIRLEYHVVFPSFDCFYLQFVVNWNNLSFQLTGVIPATSLNMEYGLPNNDQHWYTWGFIFLDYSSTFESHNCHIIITYCHFQLGSDYIVYLLLYSFAFQ